MHTNTQLLAENSQKAVALRLGEDTLARVRSETAKARACAERALLIRRECPALVCCGLASGPQLWTVGYCRMHSDMFSRFSWVFFHLHSLEGQGERTDRQGSSAGAGKAQDGPKADRLADGFVDCMPRC